MTDKDSSVPSSELTVDQIAIAFGKWMAGYRKGDELWNDLDQQAVDYVMAGSFIKPNAKAHRPEGNADAPCSVSFTPPDVDAYIAAQPYTEIGIECQAPMHDRDDLMDFYGWLHKKQNRKDHA